VSDDHNTLIVENAARLLRDAKLLVDHQRFASAFALAVLGVEEIGKVILDIWERNGPLAKPIIRRTPHLRKQAAVRSLMLASFAVAQFGDMDAKVVITDDLIERISKAFHDSPEGKFLDHVQRGVLEKTKHIGMYQDGWLTAASLHSSQFDKADVISMFETARRVTAVVDDAQIMRTGRAIYETSL
jgi:AbiV family abortive infection protein